MPKRHHNYVVPVYDSLQMEFCRNFKRRSNQHKDLIVQKAIFSIDRWTNVKTFDSKLERTQTWSNSSSSLP